jgi:HK97 family phage portal protein
VGLAADLVRRILAPLSKSAEGEYRPGPYIVTNPDGWLPDAWGKYLNYWQMGYDPIGGGSNAIVQACVQAYAQTIAMCPGDHWRGDDDGGRTRVTSSALSRILRRPNPYQSRSDFVLNLARDLYLHGNTYALALRNDRFEVDSLHPFDPKRSRPIVVEGEIFYELAGNNVIESDRAGFGFSIYGPGIIVPARNVLHVKLDAKASEPLVGIPPLRHAAASIAAQSMIGSQLINIFGSMSRPAGVIETEQNITQEQATQLRTRFNEAWRGVDNLNAGPPILTNGFKFHGISMSAKDTELAAAAKLTTDEIFMVYGVPPAILGMGQSSFASTEALMQFWLARGLGFAINHIEVALDQFFGLKGWPDEYTELDTRALLRVAYKDRIEALARGVQTGIYAPNEARNAEDLPDVEFGDEPRVQQQVVPLSAWDKAPPATPGPPAPPAADGADPDADDDDDEANDDTEAEKGLLAGIFERVADERARAA